MMMLNIICLFICVILSWCNAQKTIKEINRMPTECQYLHMALTTKHKFKNYISNKDREVMREKIRRISKNQGLYELEVINCLSILYNFIP